MRITCYGGVGQIGGNKILLEDGAARHGGQARLFFDFGIPFGDRGRFFEEFLNPRAAAGLLDVIEMGLLPPLQGIYRPDFIPTGRFWERIQRSPHLKARLRELERVDGVLISHAHVDHNGYLSFLHPDIPIYASAMTGYVAKAMQDSGRTDFEHESVYAVPREEKGGVIQTMRSTKAEPAPALQRPYRFYDLALLTPEAREFWAGTPGARELAHVPPGAADSVGGLPLRCYPVDHSIFGSTAYAVETSAGWVAYTGDLRLQGATAEATQRFVQEMARLRPRVLVCEGTRLTPEASAESAVTEEQVRANALQAIRDASGLVVADFSPRNIERLRAFLDIAQETGRHLVVLDKDAYLLDAMHLVDPQVPSVEEAPNLLIYQDLRAGMDMWQRDLRERLAHRYVGPSQVQAHLGEFILCFSFWDVKNLIDIEPPEGLYLYSSSEVYDEEGEMDIKRLHNWLRHFNMTPLGVPVETRDEMGKAAYKIPKDHQGYHASGHATGEDILNMVKSISPQTVVPVHTEHPELFVERLRGTGIEVRVPVYGVAMEYS